MAREANVFGAGLGQNDFPIFGWLVANIALLRSKGIVQERLHQFGSSGLVRIVAGQAISIAEGLSLMGFLQSRIFDVVAIDAKRRCVFGQVEIELPLSAVTGLVNGMAGIAPRVQCRMAATFVVDISSLGVAGQTEIVFLVAGSQLFQLVLVVGFVRIMACEAIANRRRMNFSLDLAGIFISVAG